jgi:transcriptional regulator with XRE-family HTH domain
MTNANPGGLDELSRTLRQLRYAAGYSTLTEAAERVGESISYAKLRRIELGESVPAPVDVETIARAYRADAPVREHLVHLAEIVKATRRRIVLSRNPKRAEFQAQIGEIEESSEQIRSFSPIIVPGLLQTSEYMWAVWNTGGGSPEDGAKFVANRLGRQAVLDRPGRRITILTTEGALGWAAGTAPMMARQMEHVARISQEKPSVRIGIVPFGVPAGVFPVSNWDLFDERAVVPGILQTQVILRNTDVAPYVKQFEQLAPLVVYGDEARAILAKVADRYRSL